MAESLIHLSEICVYFHILFNVLPKTIAFENLVNSNLVVSRYNPLSMFYEIELIELVYKVHGSYQKSPWKIHFVRRFVLGMSISYSRLVRFVNLLLLFQVLERVNGKIQENTANGKDIHVLPYMVNIDIPVLSVVWKAKVKKLNYSSSLIYCEAPEIPLVTLPLWLAQLFSF